MFMMPAIIFVFVLYILYRWRVIKDLRENMWIVYVALGFLPIWALIVYFSNK